MTSKYKVSEEEDARKQRANARATTAALVIVTAPSVCAQSD